MNERSYWQELGTTLDVGWRRFWFQPRAAHEVCVLRIIAGLFATYYFLSHTLLLVDWFGPHGLLPRETVGSLTTSFGGERVYRFSHLQLSNAPAYLWISHGLCVLLAVAYTAGIFARVTGVLTLAAVLSYVHRAPMITGQFEFVLSLLLFYLCLAPTGAAFAWDARRTSSSAVPRSVMANIALRLLQVHLAALYLMTGLTMLASEAWWTGDAVWWLMARGDSQVVDLTFLGRWQAGRYLIYLATHIVVFFMLAYGILIWQRLARPILIVVSLFVWTFLGLITGLFSYCALMIALNVAFARLYAGRATG